jgi:hypothetical protein
VSASGRDDEAEVTMTILAHDHTPDATPRTQAHGSAPERWPSPAGWLSATPQPAASGAFAQPAAFLGRGAPVLAQGEPSPFGADHD